MWILESTDAEPPLLFRILPNTLKTLGRAPRADFVVDAALVSRLHCRLALDDRDRLAIEDLGSTNGTWVNGQKIRRTPLMPGDRIRIGRVEFNVRLHQPAKESAPQH